MTSKEEVLQAIEQLKQTASQEKQEVIIAINKAVAEAVAPLQSVISFLEAQIQQGSDLSDVLAIVKEVESDVRSIVTIEEMPVTPEEPVEEPIETEPELEPEI